jgi:HlyD family secretion protein
VSNSIFRKVALDRLSTPEELDQLARIASPRGWLALLGLACLLGAAVLWSIFATIPTLVSGTGMVVSSSEHPGQLAAVLYLPLDAAGRVRPGMEVQLALATAPPEAVGRLQGAVAAVAGVPADRPAMLRVLGNEALAQSLVAQGALIEVRVALAHDPGSADGYRWSSPRAMDLAVRPGTPCTGTITVAREHPLRFIIP